MRIEYILFAPVRGLVAAGCGSLAYVIAYLAGIAALASIPTWMIMASVCFVGGTLFSLIDAFLLISELNYTLFLMGAAGLGAFALNLPIEPFVICAAFYLALELFLALPAILMLGMVGFMAAGIWALGALFTLALVTSVLLPIVLLAALCLVIADALAETAALGVTAHMSAAPATALGLPFLGNLVLAFAAIVLLERLYTYATTPTEEQVDTTHLHVKSMFASQQNDEGFLEESTPVLNI